ncbi:MAG: hypothetical protein IT466_03375 [Moraxellaceae bacterium]|jgi:uncharacterized membrane protein YheB (UPF0754 family)|nr:hypothetical protein [Moraxellaceae bacterium]MCC6199796.1 hypothetical protein [Moraxellaceae bacterium]HQV42185.1 hypothetical protein [Moraxellaceae bacterium]
MQEFFLTIWNRPDFWSYVAIPFIAAAVGWFTNWIAIQMTFWPLEFVGYKKLRLGWQGIIPSKAEKMAGIVVDNTLAKLASLSELFQQMEPEKIASHISKSIMGRIDEYVDEIMSEKNAVLWDNLPLMVKRRVYSRVRRQLPSIMDNMVDDMAENIEELLDLKQMVVTLLSGNKALMVRVFKDVGDVELRFVVNSGFYFGFLFGLIQMWAWAVYPKPWVMPFFGFLVGYATNWLALNLIFRPLDPIKVGPVTLHGLFLRRKFEVSDKFAMIATQEVINLKNLMNEVMTGPRSDRTRAMIKRHMRPLLESGVVRTAVQLTLGAEGYAQIKALVLEKAVAMTIGPLSDPSFNRERAGVIHEIFRDKMRIMSNVEFQDLLRPAFQEDEWILITLGAVLGLLAGYLQYVLMF